MERSWDRSRFSTACTSAEKVGMMGRELRWWERCWQRATHSLPDACTNKENVTLPNFDKNVSLNTQLYVRFFCSFQKFSSELSWHLYGQNNCLFWMTIWNPQWLKCYLPFFGFWMCFLWRRGKLLWNCLSSWCVGILLSASRYFFNVVMSTSKNNILLLPAISHHSNWEKPVSISQQVSHLSCSFPDKLIFWHTHPAAS